MSDTIWKKYGTTEAAKDDGYGVLCPCCGSGRNDVRDSRLGQNQIRRRRQCQVCNHKWTTYETNREPDPISKESERLRLIALTEKYLQTLKAIK